MGARKPVHQYTPCASCQFSIRTALERSLPEPTSRETFVFITLCCQQQKNPKAGNRKKTPQTSHSPTEENLTRIPCVGWTAGLSATVPSFHSDVFAGTWWS